MNKFIDKRLYKLITSFAILFAISLLFFIILGASWYMSMLGNQQLQKFFPNLFYLVNSYSIIYKFTQIVGENSISLFYFLVGVFISLAILFFYQYLNHKKKFLPIIATTILFLVIGEAVLRKLGFYPGYHTNARYFTPVEKLKEYKGFYTDENGILKIDQETGETISTRIINNQPLYSKNESSVYSLATDFLEFKNDDFDNSLKNYYNDIHRKPRQLKSDLEQAIMAYTSNPINEEGFKSIPFRSYSADKPSVLLLGDSFTWGHSTTNKTNCFADILLSKGYIVYNTGITATDVAQYLAVANKYIPTLKPDFVVVNFYLGNDISYFKREVKSNQPVLYSTNAGILMSWQNGVFFASPERAYRSVVRSWSIPQTENSFNKLMAQTSITSLIWKAMNIMNLFPYLNIQSPKKVLKENQRLYKTPYSNIELKVIKKLCLSNGSKFILSSIPEAYRFSTKTTSDFPELFGGLDYYEMKVDKSDYKLDDGHFNDQGHHKYAQFLDSLITNEEKKAKTALPKSDK